MQGGEEDILCFWELEQLARRLFIYLATIVHRKHIDTVQYILVYRRTQVKSQRQKIKKRSTTSKLDLRHPSKK